MSDPQNLVERSWFGSPDGFDTHTIALAVETVPDPDWNVETEVVRAQPFGSALVHEALAAAGDTSSLLSAIRSWSRFLENGQDTFGEGWGWGTTAHGWSSAPTRDLIAYVLGLSPMRLGGWRLAPSLGSLGRVSARVPTRPGPIEVEATPESTVVTSPVPINFVDRVGNSIFLGAGHSEIDHPGGEIRDVAV